MDLSNSLQPPSPLPSPNSLWNKFAVGVSLTSILVGCSKPTDPLVTKQTEHTSSDLPRLLISSNQMRLSDVSITGTVRSGPVTASRESMINFFAQGGAICEKFKVRGNFQPGMVLSYTGDDETGSLQPSKVASDPLFAGIAWGENFAPLVITMSQPGTLADGPVNVVLNGTTYCLCVGPVHPGDDLVTSSRVGYAQPMKSTKDAAFKIGTALEGLGQTNGLIKVLMPIPTPYRR